MGKITETITTGAKYIGATVATVTLTAAGFVGGEKLYEGGKEVTKPIRRKLGGTKIIKEKGFLGIPKNTEVYAWTNERVRDVLKNK